MRNIIAKDIDGVKKNQRERERKKKGTDIEKTVARKVRNITLKNVDGIKKKKKKKGTDIETTVAHNVSNIITKDVDGVKQQIRERGETDRQTDRQTVRQTVREKKGTNLETTDACKLKNIAKDLEGAKNSQSGYPICTLMSKTHAQPT